MNWIKTEDQKPEWTIKTDYGMRSRIFVCEYSLNMISAFDRFQLAFLDYDEQSNTSQIVDTEDYNHLKEPVRWAYVED